MRRFLIPLCALVLCVTLLFSNNSVSAATSVHDPCSVHINAADYVSNVVVEGDIKTVYYDLPLENQGFATKIQNGIYYAEPFSFMKDSRFETWGISGINKFPTYPLGRNTTFSVEDMRSGSELVFDGCFSMKGWEMNDPISPVSVTVGGIWFYYDENCKSLGYKAFKQTTVDLTYLDTEYEFTWTAEIPSGVAYVYPRIDIQFDVDAVDTIVFNCTSFAFHHDVNMLLDNSQTMQRIEKGIEDIGGKLDDLGDGIYDVKDKLDDIEQGIVGPGGTNDKLDDVKDKLDDITDYVPEPEGPEGGEISDEYVNAEDELMDEIQGGLDEVDKVQNEALTTFTSYLSAILVMTGLLDLLIEGTVMRHVLVFSLALGTCGFILNLGVKFASAVGNKGGRN